MRRYASILVLCAALTACDAIQEPPAVAELSTEQLIACGAPENALPLPPGTHVEAAEGTVSFSLPTGYFLQAVPLDDPDAEPLRAPGGDVTCDCVDEGDGSSKPAAGGPCVGCFTERSNPCTECKMTVTEDATPISPLTHRISVELGDSSSPNMENSPGAFLKMLSPAYPMNSYSDWARLPWAGAAVLKQPAVQKELDALFAEIYPNEAAPDLSGDELPAGYRWVPFNLAGHAALVAAPAQAVEADPTVNALPLQADYSCSGCDGACTLESEFFGRVKYCDGCDSGCTLHTD